MTTPSYIECYFTKRLLCNYFSLEIDEVKRCKNVLLLFVIKRREYRTKLLNRINREHDRAARSIINDTSYCV